MAIESRKIKPKRKSKRLVAFRRVNRRRYESFSIKQKLGEEGRISHGYGCRIFDGGIDRLT